MTDLLTEAFKKAQNLPEDIQNELAKQLIQDIESEYQWQETLEKPQSSFLDKLAKKAINESLQGKTKKIGFDEI
ncbi:hypothetical protein [Cyanothece sp. BG0011]|uniref:hypothetical protein n=1 Tax=Cyanothece sp. BG0011 TaxID=2082950 RepID=UPI000D1F934E|nr:hypothetical protein [Cyanothece sp. BG0011]